MLDGPTVTPETRDVVLGGNQDRGSGNGAPAPWDDSSSSVLGESEIDRLLPHKAHSTHGTCGGYTSVSMK